MGKKRRTRRSQIATDLRREGLNAFQAGDYSRAIDKWEQAGQKISYKLPKSALAEAYFRRGLNHLYGQAADDQMGLDDLRQAIQLQPDDPRYVYHLGLALHRRAGLDEAIRAYRSVREGDGEFAERAAYPLALALFQRGDDPADAPVWSALSVEEQAMLREMDAFRRRPYTLSDDAPLLWRGLAALDAGDSEEAQSMLERVLEESVDSVDRRMAHYYLGVLAGQKEDWSEARHQWNAARAAGIGMPRLESNLQETYHRLAEERLEVGEVEGALAAAEEALRHGSSYNSLEKTASQARQRLAYQAASDGGWAIAREHWEAADAAEDGAFRLAYNLALAHEHAEEFIAAGERWREALRRRPRRDDHVDAVTDEQVARLWRRAADAYTKAGEYDEAVNVYKNAVKWNPDNIDARLALSEALLANGQTQAAENELNRILERDSDNVAALLRLGEVAYAEGSWWRNNPLPYWERVLELEPDNRRARQSLVDFHREQAENALRWNNYERAIDMYHQALDYQPKNAQILAALGGCCLRMDDEFAARPYFEDALEDQPADLGVYDEIIRAWLDVDDLDRAWDVMEKAETAVSTVPYQFYIHQASYCLYDYPIEVVRPWLDRAVEVAPPGDPVLVSIGEMATMHDAFDLAREYLGQAVETGQTPGQAHLLLGIIAARDGDEIKAEIHWEDAAKIAHRSGDHELLERIEHARFLFNPPPGLLDFLRGPGSRAFNIPPFPDFLDV